MADDDKTSALEVVERFISSIFDKSSDPHDFVIETSFSVQSHPGELIVGTLKDYVIRAEKTAADHLSRGAKNVKEVLTKPASETWLYDDIAAVFTGYAVVVDGQEVGRGVRTYGLLKKSGGWKISGIAEEQWPAGEELPPLSREFIPGVRERIDHFFDSLTAADFDGMLADCLPGSGITLSRAQGHGEFPWPVLIARLKSILESGAPGEEKVFDLEPRVVGNTAFVWTPFWIVDKDDKTVAKGVNIITLLKRDDGWVISGVQDTNRAV